MRLLGFVLLWLGFLWIANVQLMFQLRMGARSVVDAQTTRIEASATEFHDREQVRQFVIAAVVNCYDRLPMVILPGGLMLIGGYFVAYAPRRRRTNSPASGKVR